jgi:hypothetical protein
VKIREELLEDVALGQLSVLVASIEKGADQGLAFTCTNTMEAQFMRAVAEFSHRFDTPP